MKKKMILLTVELMCVLMLSGCKCKHVWQDANCETPQVCSKCGETSGAALGHSWEAATCTAPETCATCGKIRGLALGHTWTEATCTQAETCSACGMTKGEPLEHTWTDANYQQPKTCTLCEITEGEPLTAMFEAYGLEAPTAEPGSQHSMTVGDIPVTIFVEQCQKIEAENSVPTTAGYEWVAVTVRMTSEEDLSVLEHSNPVYFNFTDYYDAEGLYNSLDTQEEEEQTLTTFGVNYQGADYSECAMAEGAMEFVAPEDSENGIGYMVMTWYFHIPQDYDGITLMFADNIRLETEYENDVLKLFGDEETVFLRISEI